MKASGLTQRHRATKAESSPDPPDLGVFVPSCEIDGSGTNTLKWRYAKDYALPTGDDCGWVDWVRWTGYTPEPPANRWRTLTYTYDASGRRIEKKYDGDLILKYVYDADHCIAEYDVSNNLRRKYIYGPCVDEPICMTEATGSYAGTYYYHFDALGSVVALTNSSGNTVEVYEYSVFGQVGASDANHPNRFMFTGREFDKETGLYYYRARYYNPQIGRFLQTDPLGYGAGMNLYRYCANSPIGLRDPFGRDPKSISIAFYNGAGDMGPYLLNRADDMDYRFDLSKCPSDIDISDYIKWMLKFLKRDLGDKRNQVAGVYFFDHSLGPGHDQVDSLQLGNQEISVDPSPDNKELGKFCKVLDEVLPATTAIHFRCCSLGNSTNEAKLGNIAVLTNRTVTAARGWIYDFTNPDGTPCEMAERDKKTGEILRDANGKILNNYPDYYCDSGYVQAVPFEGTVDSPEGYVIVPYSDYGVSWTWVY
jgi:RHS repeat-associated protein